VKRWRTGDQRERWIGSGLIFVQRNFRRIVGCNAMPKLVAVLQAYTVRWTPLFGQKTRFAKVDPLPSEFLSSVFVLIVVGPVGTVEKPSVCCSAFPSSCGKKQRSVLLFSIGAAVSTGLPFLSFLLLFSFFVLS
jgi:hypothetical protein